MQVRPGHPRRAIIACDVTVPTRLRSQIDQAGSKKARGSAGASAGCKWGREPGSTSFPLRAPPADTSHPIFTPKALPWSLPCPGRGGCCARGHLLKTVGSKSPLISVHLARPCTAQWGWKASAPAVWLPSWFQWAQPPTSSFPCQAFGDTASVPRSPP